MQLSPLRFLLLLLGLVATNLAAQPKIAVLDFELRDLTYIPGIPKEIERTASLKPMLEAELKNYGYQVVDIPLADQKQASAGFGYLFDHHDYAADLAQKYNADYVVVGRLHKPSFLFAYMMAHVVDVKAKKLAAEYSAEVKGGEKKLTGKGIESLGFSIDQDLKRLR